MDVRRFLLPKERRNGRYVSLHQRIEAMRRLVVTIKERVGKGREHRQRVPRQYHIHGIGEHLLHEGKYQRVGRGLVQTDRLRPFPRQIPAIQDVAIGAACVPVVLFMVRQLLYEQLL